MSVTISSSPIPEPSAPVRPLTVKGRATRDRIVEVAAALMFEHTVAGTSIDDIRRAAGVSGSQMSHYFGSKQELVLAVIEHQARTILTVHRSPALGRMDSFDALRHWAQTIVALQRQRQAAGGCILGSLAGELAERDPVLREEIASWFREWTAVFSEGLALMRERGELRADADPEQLATFLLSLLQGGLLLAQTARSTAPLEASLRAGLAHVRSFAPLSHPASGSPAR